MAEEEPKAEVQAVHPPPKRRRILDPSAIVPVPVYSNKVNSSLQLKPLAAVFTEKEKAGKTDDDADDSLWSEFSSRGSTADLVTLSDSEEDDADCLENKEQKKLEPVCCPSPPPPESPVQKQSKKVKQKLSEIDRKLRAVNSLFSPEPQDRNRSRHDHSSCLFEEEQDDEDVILVTPDSGSQSLPYSSSAREIPLKIRCRTEIHKISVLSTTPFSDVVTKLSVILNVPPSRLLLLREEVELQTDSTVAELRLGIADIIECVVMAAEDRDETNEGSSSSSSSNITVRLQGKDRDSSQEFSLDRDAPLGPIFSQYLSKMSVSTQRKVCFHFDGSKVTQSQTPAQLNMENGDIIEVWA